MGFSVSGATGLILIGFLFSVGTLTTGIYNAQRSVDSAGHEAELRAAAERHGALRIDNESYNASTTRLFVNATNTGSVTFSVDRLDLVVNGVVATSSVTSKTVNGVETNVWAPFTRLQVDATAATPPTAIVVVAPTGAAAYWRA